MAQTGRLIELVKKFPMLYDLSDEDHQNVRKKDMVWNKIGEELNASGSVVKKRWKNLRDSYVKYLKSNKLRADQDENKKKWLWSKEMEAFMPFFPNAQIYSNVSVLPENEEVSSDVDNSGQDNKLGYTDTTDHELDYEESEDPLLSQSIPFPSSISCTKKRKLEENNMPSSVNSLLTYFHKKETEKSDLDMLFAAYAKTVKKFTPKRQVITKMKIAELLMEQELLDIVEQQNSESNSFKCNL